MHDGKYICYHENNKQERAEEANPVQESIGCVYLQRNEPCIGRKNMKKWNSLDEKTKKWKLQWTKNTKKVPLQWTKTGKNNIVVDENTKNEHCNGWNKNSLAMDEKTRKNQPCNEEKHEKINLVLMDEKTQN